MSSIQHSRDWLGTSGDWGLTAHKHGEMCDELSDHLGEMARVESHGVAEDAKESLSQPKVRRKLAGVHLADQVYATLNRRPNRKEWFELLALGLWYVLIIISDIVSLKAIELAGDQARINGMVFTSFNVESPLYIPWVSLAWLLQGVAKGGFYASFCSSLWRAWRIGAGVCLARILQLKLIHTLLVIGAFLSIGNRLWEYFNTPLVIETGGPIWLAAPTVLLIGLSAAAVVLGVSRGRRWVPALGLALMAIFLYPAAPVVVENFRNSSPLAFEVKTMPDGTKILEPSKDPEKIAKWAEIYLEKNDPQFVDQANNRFYSSYISIQAAANTYWSDNHFAREPNWGMASNHGVSSDFHKNEFTGTYLAAPVSAPGSALSWIAAPIPLLGVIGLFGLLFLMGRRGVIDAVLYSGLVFFAVASTILPFGFAGSSFKLFDFSPMGVVLSPCPGFEGLLVNLKWQEDGLLVLGLVLSAAIPWLLTSLFLKPGQSGQQTDDSDEMQEAG